jgi:isoleucyl-tRNA synthetase
MREVVRHVQAASKQAELNVDDRINLWLGTEDDNLAQAIDEHKVGIATETLAEKLSTTNKKDEMQFETIVKVEGSELAIGLERNK